jgi:23S rRNA-/tRNA-specific pseudouridylate synthase
MIMETKRAGIVHRLDMPVSGLIVFAKNRKFQNILHQAI